MENLLELYIHDLSEAFDVEIGPDGRFGYPGLPLYWSQPDRRFAFLVKVEAQVIGFVLVTAGSPMSDDPNVHDIAEFFILRRHRRLGIGKRAAVLAWNHFPGRWIVRAAANNLAAVSFWRGIIAEYSGGTSSESQRQSSQQSWKVFSFHTP